MLHNGFNLTTARDINMLIIKEADEQLFIGWQTESSIGLGEPEVLEESISLSDFLLVITDECGSQVHLSVRDIPKLLAALDVAKKLNWWGE